MELERRDWQVDRLEIRGTGESRTVRGQAVPINRFSDDLGGFREVIRPGAVTESVRNNDIYLLWQHDTALPISKTTAKRHALVLEERKTGVWFEQPAAAFTEFQLSKIDDGVVDKMSFGFFVENREDETWHEDQTPVLREIHKMNLKEISPVTFAAYNSTKVAVRSAAAHGIVLPKPKSIMQVKQVVGVAIKATDPKAIAAEHKREREKIRLVAEPPHDVRRRRARPVVREYPSASAWNLLRSGPDGHTIRSIAFHESGHCVAGVIAGSVPAEVFLYSERCPNSGKWKFTGGVCRFREFPEGALVHMAGEAAEILSGHHRTGNRTGRGKDNRSARERTQQDTILRDLGDAKSLLRRHWPAVKALARRLMAEQRVPGLEARQLILDHLDLAARLRLRDRGAA